MSTPLPKPASKRPVAQRFDSTVEVGECLTKRPHVSQARIHSQQQSRLFRLPCELRLMIYELAVPNSAIPYMLAAKSPVAKSSSSSTEDRYASHQDSATEPAFLQTCRLARQEALPLFYRQNDFLLPRRPSLDFRHPLNLSLNPALMPRKKASKSKKNILSSRWLYTMDSDKIAKITAVVFAQEGRGMYKDERNEWRMDASACFRVKVFGGPKARACGGKGYEVEYLRMDASGGSERYAERLVKALDSGMEALVGGKGVGRWTREHIWNLAYLL